MEQSKHCGRISFREPYASCEGAAETVPVSECGNTAFVEGNMNKRFALSGSHVAEADLRCGAALVLAGMAAKGATEVTGVAHIDRGYEKFEAKPLSLGADDIRRELKS